MGLDFRAGSRASLDLNRSSDVVVKSSSSSSDLTLTPVQPIEYPKTVTVTDADIKAENAVTEARLLVLSLRDKMTMMDKQITALENVIERLTVKQ